jgi:hypothetical protein
MQEAIRTPRSEYIMSEYRLRTIVNGVPTDLLKACPTCDSSNLTYPAYRNKYALKGLTQPNGAVNDQGFIEISGIARPETNDEPSGYFRPVPSGLQRTYKHPYANEGSMGVDTVTYYAEANWYEPYWCCNTCHAFFVNPVPQKSSLPSGVNGIVMGDYEHPIDIDPFSQFV